MCTNVCTLCACVRVCVCVCMYVCAARMHSCDYVRRSVPNCAVRPRKERRLFVGDQMSQLIDFSSLVYRRPSERVCGESDCQLYGLQHREVGDGVHPCL